MALAGASLLPLFMATAARGQQLQTEFTLKTVAARCVLGYDAIVAGTVASSTVIAYPPGDTAHCVLVTELWIDVTQAILGTCPSGRLRVLTYDITGDPSIPCIRKVNGASPPAIGQEGVFLLRSRTSSYRPAPPDLAGVACLRFSQFEFLARTPDDEVHLRDHQGVTHSWRYEDLVESLIAEARDISMEEMIAHSDVVAFARIVAIQRSATPDTAFIVTLTPDQVLKGPSFASLLLALKTSYATPPGGTLGESTVVATVRNLVVLDRLRKTLDRGTKRVLLFADLSGGALLPVGIGALPLLPDGTVQSPAMLLGELATDIPIRVSEVWETVR